jgi:hypothetical protein
LSTGPTRDEVRPFQTSRLRWWLFSTGSAASLEFVHSDNVVKVPSSRYFHLTDAAPH